ncbi:hypothetical protein ACWD6N_03710 [Micromonospora sp. NPDC005163]
MDTNPTNRRPVEQLTAGVHIADVHGVHELVHSLPYSNGDGSPMYALTLRPIGSGEPWVERHAKGVKVHLATDAEVAEAVDAVRRFALAQALRALADDIVDRNLPVSAGWFSVGPGVLDSRDDLNRWAAYFGAEVTMGGTAGDIPVVRASRPVMAGLRLDFHAQSSAEPVAAPLQVDAAIAAAAALEPKDTGRLAECGCHIFQDPLQDDPEVIHDTACQDWYFTFGAGHVHPESPAINAEGGASLADRYVVIRGTHESARAIMLRFFGRAWCDQYGSAERAGVNEFCLTELARRHWPTPAADATPTQQAGE